MTMFDLIPEDIKEGFRKRVDPTSHSLLNLGKWRVISYSGGKFYTGFFPSIRREFGRPIDESEIIDEGCRVYYKSVFLRYIKLEEAMSVPQVIEHLRSQNLIKLKK